MVEKKNGMHGDVPVCYDMHSGCFTFFNIYVLLMFLFNLVERKARLLTNKHDFLTLLHLSFFRQCHNLSEKTSRTAVNLIEFLTRLPITLMRSRDQYQESIERSVRLSIRGVKMHTVSGIK